MKENEKQNYLVLRNSLDNFFSEIEPSVTIIENLLSTLAKDAEGAPITASKLLNITSKALYAVSTKTKVDVDNADELLEKMASLYGSLDMLRFFRNQVADLLIEKAKEESK